MEFNEFEKAQIQYEQLQLKERIDIKFISDFKNEIINSKNDFNKLNEIEKKYGNFFDDVEKIINTIELETKFEKNEKVRKREDGFIVGYYQDSLGVLGLIYDGNPYITIDILIKAVYSKNGLVICTNNKMYATNKLIVLCMQEILEKYGYSGELVQIINSENYEEMYKHNNILKKVIVIGNRDFQDKYLAKFNIGVISSGYNYYDVYIEDIMDENLLKNIIAERNAKLNFYINSSISKEKIENLGIENYIEVENIMECIRDININSSMYCSTAFTKNGENANLFLKLVKSKNVLVNSNPLIEKSLDISLNDLLYQKTVLYSNN